MSTIRGCEKEKLIPNILLLECLNALDRPCIDTDDYEADCHVNCEGYHQKCHDYSARIHYLIVRVAALYLKFINLLI
jgi:hypothetical protein